MTRQQKAVLASVGAPVAVLLVVVLLLVVLGGDEGAKVSAGETTTSSSTSTSSTTETTVELSPVTSGPPPTVEPAPTPTPTTAAPQPVVDGTGALLTNPVGNDVRTSSGPCESLGSGEPGWTVSCGALVARGGVELAWLIEKRSADGATRTYVLRRTQPTSWAVVLSALDPTGARFAEVKVAVADVSGDGRQEVAFGFRSRAEPEVLSVDLVEGPGAVAVHRELAHGAARVSTGQLNTWMTDPAETARVTKQIIRFTEGAWRIVSTVTEPGPPPASHL